MADIASTLAGWLSTTASNAPAGSTTIGTGLDDNLRELQGVVVRGLSHKGADIASATTTDIGAIEGLMHDITGTTTITGLGTVRAGIWKLLKFEGALTLTHNATSLILPGGANITTADGDAGIFMSEGSGNWRCVAWQPVGTTQIAATQAQQETGTATTAVVTPGRQHFHQSAAKAWVRFNTVTSTTNTASYNIASLTDTGTGITTINFTTAFSGATAYNAVGAARYTDTINGVVNFQTFGTTSVICRTIDMSDNGTKDMDLVNGAFFGDQ